MIRRFSIAALILAWSILGVAAMGLKSFDSQAFSEALSDDKIIVVLVSGDQCEACSKQESAIDGLSKEAALSHVEFIKADFEKNKDFMTANKVSKQSIILIFKDGEEIERLDGVTDVETIETKVKAAVV